jgi:hypothetical protein
MSLEGMRTRPSRQPERLAWSKQELLRRRYIALGMVHDTSSNKTYDSALNSYLKFCEIHERSPEPTPDTLSFFIVFMCAHINPNSVSNYLSGIVTKLEPYYPQIREHRNSPLVRNTLKGCRRLHGRPVTRRLPLDIGQLAAAAATINNHSSHDDLLFVAMLFTGFRGLLRLGEMTQPDDLRLRNPFKFSKRSSVEWFEGGYSFWLTTHKTDQAFEGAKIVIPRHEKVDALPWFSRYMDSRDRLFPFNPYLWVTASGSVPTRQWFIRRLRSFIPDHRFAGQSLRAGGATFLEEDGTPFHLIRAIGRWSSDTFNIYIRKNPVLLQIILAGRSTGA